MSFKAPVPSSGLQACGLGTVVGGCWSISIAGVLMANKYEIEGLTWRDDVGWRGSRNEDSNKKTSWQKWEKLQKLKIFLASFPSISFFRIVVLNHRIEGFLHWIKHQQWSSTERKPTSTADNQSLEFGFYAWSFSRPQWTSTRVRIKCNTSSLETYSFFQFGFVSEDEKNRFSEFRLQVDIIAVDCTPVYSDPLRPPFVLALQMTMSLKVG